MDSTCKCKFTQISASHRDFCVVCYSDTTLIRCWSLKYASLILMIAVTCQGSYLISACSLTCIIIVPRSYESRGRRNGNIQTDPRFFVTGTGYVCLCSDKSTGGARTVDSASISSRRLRPFVRVRFLVSVYSTIRTANATRALAETIKTQRCPYICR